MCASKAEDPENHRDATAAAEPGFDRYTATTIMDVSAASRECAQPGDSTSARAIRGRLVAGLLIACGIYVALSLLLWNQIEEDAFIYFRNAVNLAEGYGYVFNRGGPRIETGSSLLWLLLLTGLHVFPVAIVTASKFLGIAFGVLCVVLTGMLAARVTARPESAVVPALLLAVSVPFVMWGQLGLETPLYGALLLWTALWVCDERTMARAWIPAALLLFGRPEAPALAFAMLLFLAAGRRGWRATVRPMAWLFAIALTAETARFLYFHDLVSAPFYLKMGSGDFRAIDVLWSFLAGSNLLWLGLPILAAAWRPAFWSRERALVATCGALLFAWAARTGDPMPFGRHFVPALPFFYVLVAAGIEDVASRLGAVGRIARATALAAAWCLVALDPRVPYGRLDERPSPIHAAVGAFVAEPARYARALAAELRDPQNQTFLDEDEMIFHGPIEHNWQALIGKYIAANHPPDVVVVYDQMGQTPYYAGADTVFIDGFGLTDRAAGLHRFDERARRSLSLAVYGAVAGALVGWAFPDERRHYTLSEATDAVFAAQPDLVIVNRVAAARGGTSVTSAIRSHPRLQLEFEPRYLLGGWAELYERRGRPQREPFVPDGLEVSALQVDDVNPHRDPGHEALD